MFASQYINHIIPVLKSTDSLEMALNWMEEFHTSQMVLIHEGKYLGILSEDNILDVEKEGASVADVPLEFENVFVLENQHLFEIVKVFTPNKMKVIAVLDEKLNYSGLVTAYDILEGLAELTSAAEGGSIVVLHVGYHNYSLAEISKLTETNDAKVLSVNITHDTKNKGMIIVTLKINKIEISSIISTFERYQYKILTTFSESKIYEHQVERYNALMKFLEF